MAVAPDGHFAAFVLQETDLEENGYSRHLWRCDLTSGELRQLTRGKASCTQPDWSPDGRWIAFCSNRSKKREVELWLLPTDGGEAHQLTSLGGTVTTPRWSPDSNALVFGFRELDPQPEKEEEKKQHPDFHHVRRLSYKLDGDGFLPASRWQVMTVGIDGETPRALTEGPFDHSGARFSPDGGKVVLTANREEPLDSDIERSDLWVVPASGGALDRLTDSPGPAEMPQFSADGEWIYYVGHTGAPGKSMIESYHLWRVPARGGEAEDMTPQLDRSIGNLTLGDVRDANFYGPAPLISPDGRTITFAISDSGSCRLWRLDAVSRTLTEVPVELPDVFDTGVSADGERLVYLASDLDSAGELFVLDGEADSRCLTDLNPWLADRRLMPIEEFTVPGSPDLQAWRVSPDGPGPHPTILEIHGGPHTQYGRVMMHEFQVLAGMGYQVLFSNPRGSQGYGRSFADAIHGDWGGPAHEDLMRVADHAVAAGWADPDRLGVAGGSYGGYMTVWMLGHTTRFKAACAQRLVSNMESMFGTSDVGWFFSMTIGGKPPWEDRESYVRCSPISYVDQIETPLLIIHSEEDHRCPMEQAEQVFTALRYRGVETELVRFKGESHGLSRGGRPQSRLERLRQITGWFAERL